MQVDWEIVIAVFIGWCMGTAPIIISIIKNKNSRRR